MMVEAEPGSFRDPSGQVFLKDGRIFRTVNPSIAEDFDFAENSGLFHELIEKGWLIGYEKADALVLGAIGSRAIHVLEHPRLPLVSYPYEWPFLALKAAALLHLDVHLAALERNVTLSDSTAYNVQFVGTRPLFIDVLSFIRYRDGDLWTGHGQFCEQFLNPLLLQSYLGVSHNSWFRGALEGIPVEDLAKLLPWWRRLMPRLFMHVVLQSAFQRRAKNSNETKGTVTTRAAKLPKPALQRMLRGLKDWIDTLEHRKRGKTVWESYAEETSYDAEETQLKKAFIADFIQRTGAKQVWDLGCNTGNYLVSALEAGADYGVGFDFDQGALEAGFARAHQKKLPIQFLYLDAANPSPDQGWAQQERQGLLKRANADAVFALAFIHHLAISKNIPLKRLVGWLVDLAPMGIIEFVPKEDPMVQVLLRSRRDIFPDYSEDAFRLILKQHAEIVREKQVSFAGRRLFWFKRT